MTEQQMTDEELVELSPCPFCGKSDFLTNGDPNPKRLACGNDDCDFLGVWLPLALWQSRPLENTLYTRIKVLEIALQKLSDLFSVWEAEGTITEGEQEMVDIVSEALKDQP